MTTRQKLIEKLDQLIEKCGGPGGKPGPCAANFQLSSDQTKPRASIVAAVVNEEQRRRHRQEAVSHENAARAAREIGNTAVAEHHERQAEHHRSFIDRLMDYAGQRSVNVTS